MPKDQSVPTSFHQQEKNRNLLKEASYLSSFRKQCPGEGCGLSACGKLMLLQFHLSRQAR
eukprot:261382-Amphidinium_carterae.1